MDELARWRAAALRSGGRSQDNPDRSSEASTESVAESGGANVMVLGATNAPEAVDTAFLRPGRFDEVRGMRDGLWEGGGRVRKGASPAPMSFYVVSRSLLLMRGPGTRA